MGQQQLLLILLSVVIVGAAITTGVGAFNAQAKTANRSAIISDMVNLANLAIAFYKTPVIQGGGGSSWDITRFYQFCGYPKTPDGERIQTDNGQILMEEISLGRLSVRGWGTEIGFNEGDEIQALLILAGTNIDEMAFTILN